RSPPPLRSPPPPSRQPSSPSVRFDPARLAPGRRALARCEREQPGGPVSFLAGRPREPLIGPTVARHPELNRHCGRCLGAADREPSHCHACLSLPRPTQTRLAEPAGPDPAPPCRAKPCRACPARPNLAAPHLAVPAVPCR